MSVPLVAKEDKLVNTQLVMGWLYSALIWMTIFPIVGILVSLKFHNPEFLGDNPWLTFGRLRPMHVNGVIFGSFSTTIFGLLYYMVPKLCGVRLYKEEWGRWLVPVWNIVLVAASLSLMAGYNQGIEAGEYPWWIDAFVEVAFLAITIQIFGTIIRRTEKQLYVSLWYLMAGFIWTCLNLPMGNFILPYFVPGINNAALHGLYIHYIVGLWITPAGLAVIYYFLPVSVKNPLYSHKLSMIGFWSLAFFYPFVGIHHYLYSPIANWVQTIAIVTSMMLIVPVWTVIQNFFGTMSGKWHAFVDDFAAKFLILGALFYLIGCFQGSTEALRTLQTLTHFSDFVIAHSHLTIFGTFILWVTAGIYYVWPKITGRELWSRKLASWHFWLTVTGFGMMATILTVQGLVQGGMLIAGSDFVDSVVAMRPYWELRTLAGIVMDVGMVLFAYNMWKSATDGPPVQAEEPAPQSAAQAA